MVEVDERVADEALPAEPAAEPLGRGMLSFI